MEIQRLQLLQEKNKLLYEKDCQLYELKGELKGELKAKKEIAQELLKSGVDSRVIATATHLTKAQIEELKKSLH